MVEPLGMLRRQHRVRRGMVVNHVDDALHPQPVGLVHQAVEVVQRAVLRVHPPVVPDGVRAAQHPLAGLFPDGVDGQQPDHVRTQLPDTGQIPPHPLKGALLGVVTHKNGVDYLVPPGLFRVFRHGAFLLNSFLFHRARWSIPAPAWGRSLLCQITQAPSTAELHVEKALIQSVGGILPLNQSFFGKFPAP